MSPRRANPMLSVDVVALRMAEGGLTIGLGSRMFEPHLGQLALPGVLMLAGERVVGAARRAVISKLGVRDDAVLAMVVGQVYDTPERDERGPTVSIGCIAVVDADTPGTATWVGFDEVPQLPFDHSHIIDSTRRALRALIWEQPSLVRALLGESFATKDMAAIDEALHGRRRNPANVHRQLEAAPWAQRDPKPIVAGRGRPQTGWRIDGGVGRHEHERHRRSDEPAEIRNPPPTGHCPAGRIVSGR